MPAPPTEGPWLDGPRAALLVLGAASSALIAGAWFFELVVGLQPCKLCLLQRVPHYAVMAVSLAAFTPTSLRRARVVALGLALGGIVTAAALGGHHVGVEQGWWLGPADCGGRVAASAASVGDFLKDLGKVKVVSCTQASWTFLGVSMAGWNAVCSLAALAAGIAALNRDYRNGSAAAVLR